MSLRVNPWSALGLDCGVDAEELFEDTAPSREVADMLGSWPFSCIDWERAGRELDLGGDVFTAAAPEGRIFVFRNI